MNLTRHILATLAIAVAFGAAAIAGDNTLLEPGTVQNLVYEPPLAFCQTRSCAFC